METIQDFFQHLTAWQILVLALALVFLAIGLRLIFKKPPAHLTAFNGESGSVLVSRKALQELVRSACLLDEWVEAARPIIRVKANKVTAKVELRLNRPDNLKAVCERVQNHITSLLQKSLSFEQIGEIQIVVKSFGQDTSEANELLESPKPPPPDSTLLPRSSPVTDSSKTAEPANEPSKESNSDSKS